MLKTLNAGVALPIPRAADLENEPSEGCCRDPSTADRLRRARGPQRRNPDQPPAAVVSACLDAATREEQAQLVLETKLRGLELCHVWVDLFAPSGDALERH
jgi:hypothetical protein